METILNWLSARRHIGAIPILAFIGFVGYASYVLLFDLAANGFVLTVLVLLLIVSLEALQRANARSYKGKGHR